MDQALEAVFAEYDARVAREAETFRSMPPQDFGSRRDEFLLAVGPETGRLMNTLARGAGATRILEIGTSYGYSTHWLADAARATGGKVTTLDLAAEKQDYARAMLEKAGLAAFVDLRLGDAVHSIEDLSGPFDFVLLDLWKDLYVPCLERFFPKLAPGAVVVADNMVHPANAHEHASAYRRAIRAKPGVTSVLLHVGSGIEVSRLEGPLDPMI